MSGPDKAASRFVVTSEAADNDFGNRPDSETVVGDSLYEFVKVDGSQWNALFPYQLQVVQKTDDGWGEVGTGPHGWLFNLPISPQSLEIDMPFAITTSATLGGVVEEHNGAPFRMISLSGTTGVLPLKGTPDSGPSASRQFNPAPGIFAGTINAASTLQADMARALDITTPNIVPDSEFKPNSSSLISRTSGYYQWHQLRQFLEVYAQKKKRADGATFRLVFSIWKDDSSYLVTPVLFKTQRDASSPYEYRYQLNFKAWGRIKIHAKTNKDETSVTGRNPNLFAKIVNVLGAARTAIEDSQAIIQSARADIENQLLIPLREVQLAAKGIAGVAISLADLPGNIITDSKEAVVSVNSQLDDLKNVRDDIKQKFIALGLISDKSATGDGRTETARQALDGAHPAVSVFNRPNDFHEIFSQIDPARLKLPISVQKKINAEKARVAAFTRADYEERRDRIASVLADFAESVGAGNDTFNQLYNVKPRTTTTRVATDDDFDVIYTLGNIITQLNKLCVSNRIDPNQVSPIDYIAGLARQSGIAFKEARSKFLVPFLVDHTLEELALRYLGDANRWHEIAALNGLREPYIDEEGFDKLLSTNGQGNIIQISDVTNLYIGQTVWISSSTVRPERRRIEGIMMVTAGVNFITLNGDGDLDKFLVGGQSKIHAYLPDTINSQMSLYIPSQDESQYEDFQVKPIQGVDYFDNLVRVGGISLLLDSNNDIIFTKDGRTQLAVGLTNIVQKTRIALSTPQGSLLQHPKYGLPVQIGESTADVSANNVLKSIQEMFGKDPSFSGVTSAAVSKNGGTTFITVNVGIAGTSQVVPITAEIRR